MGNSLKIKDCPANSYQLLGVGEAPALRPGPERLGGFWSLSVNEVKHVVNTDTKASFSNARAEELGCDEFAISILMDKVDEYANAENYPKKDVLFKRASAIAISLFVTAVISKSAGQDSGSHPSFKTRIMQLIGIIALDDDSFFWVLMVCLLMSYMRKVVGVNTEVELISAKEACIRLIGKL